MTPPEKERRVMGSSPSPGAQIRDGASTMNHKGKSTRRGKAAYKHRSRRTMRRKRAGSDAQHDTMRDGRRLGKTGAAK